MPPPEKMFQYEKTPENSTLRAYQIKIRINPILQAFFSDQYRRRIFLSPYPYKNIDICSFSRAYQMVNAFCYTNLPHITNSITYTTIIPSSITYNILSYTILYTIYYNRNSHYKILYSISLYQYYNIVNTCNHIVTIIFDMRYNYLNKYNYINSITKNQNQ